MFIYLPLDKICPSAFTEYVYDIHRAQLSDLFCSNKWQRLSNCPREKLTGTFPSWTNFLKLVGQEALGVSRLKAFSFVKYVKEGAKTPLALPDCHWYRLKSEFYGVSPQLYLPRVYTVEISTRINLSIENCELKLSCNWLTRSRDSVHCDSSKQLFILMLCLT